MEEFLIISFFVSISFFVFKLVLNKIKKEKDNENSGIVRDSLYIFFITFIVIYAYSMFFKKGSGKTPVFTNEPGF
jgi:hypothetical protein